VVALRPVARRGPHDEHGLFWFETPIAHLPYNGVIRTRIEGGVDVARLVAAVADGFRSRRVQSFWVIHPTTAPAELVDLLAEHGAWPVSA
jgi:hypothetical protein